MDRSEKDAFVHDQILRLATRRQFFRDCVSGIGTVALASLLEEGLFSGVLSAQTTVGSAPTQLPGAPKAPHFAPRVKNVIFLHMAGAPSQLDLFDHKPKLQELHGKDCPAEVIAGEQFAFIRGTPKILGSPYEFGRYGENGQEISPSSSPTCTESPTTSPWCARCTPTSSTTHRRSSSSTPASPSPSDRAWGPG